LASISDLLSDLRKTNVAFESSRKSFEYQKQLIDFEYSKKEEMRKKSEQDKQNGFLTNLGLGILTGGATGGIMSALSGGGTKESPAPSMWESVLHGAAGGMNVNPDAPVGAGVASGLQAGMGAVQQLKDIAFKGKTQEKQLKAQDLAIESGTEELRQSKEMFPVAIQGAKEKNYAQGLQSKQMLEDLLFSRESKTTRLGILGQELDSKKVANKTAEKELSWIDKRYSSKLATEEAERNKLNADTQNILKDISGEITPVQFATIQKAGGYADPQSTSAALYLSGFDKNMNESMIKQAKSKLISDKTTLVDAFSDTMKGKEWKDVEGEYLKSKEYQSASPREREIADQAIKLSKQKYYTVQKIKNLDIFKKIKEDQRDRVAKELVATGAGMGAMTGLLMGGIPGSAIGAVVGGASTYFTDKELKGIREIINEYRLNSIK